MQTLGIGAAWRQTRLTVTRDAKIRCQILDSGVSRNRNRDCEARCSGSAAQERAREGGESVRQHIQLVLTGQGGGSDVKNSVALKLVVRSGG